MTVVKPLSSHQINHAWKTDEQCHDLGRGMDAQSQITQMQQISAEHCKQRLETQEEDHPRILSSMHLPTN